MLPDLFGVSRETLAKLKIYEQLLQKWQKSINLIGPATLNDIWLRHFQDSLQLIPYIPPGNLWDIGSGAGFPGMPLAMTKNDNAVTLVDSDQRKCAFLKSVSRETRTNVTVINDRIERITPVNSVQCITARALAPLISLLNQLDKIIFLNPFIRLVFLKGENWRDEVLSADKIYAFTLDTHSSVVDKAGMILIITNIVKR